MNLYRVHTKSGGAFEVFGDKFEKVPTRNLIHFKAAGAPNDGVTAEIVTTEIIAIVLVKADAPGGHLTGPKKT